MRGAGTKLIAAEQREELADGSEKVVRQIRQRLAGERITTSNRSRSHHRPEHFTRSPKAAAPSPSAVVFNSSVNRASCYAASDRAGSIPTVASMFAYCIRLRVARKRLATCCLARRAIDWASAWC